MKKRKIFQIDPILESRIWGGRSLIKMFDLKTDLPNVAEIYSVIAIPNHLDCNVREENIPLSQFYLENRELFGCNLDYLPVRMVIGNQVAPLSVQVHPSDEYGLKYSGMRGKPESEWLLGEGEGYMILGHHAKSKKEFIDLTNKKEWDKLFRKVTVHGGDFIDIPQGTLHGSAGEGVCVAFSTNGDVTYRLYDYDRVDKDGNPRELHIEHVFNNVTIPDDKKEPLETTEIEKDGCHITEFLDRPGLYACGKIKIKNKGEFCLTEFYFILCVEGIGVIDGRKIKAGETFFIPCGYGKIMIEGNVLLAYISYRDK